MLSELVGMLRSAMQSDSYASLRSPGPRLDRSPPLQLAPCTKGPECRLRGVSVLLVLLRRGGPLLCPYSLAREALLTRAFGLHLLPRKALGPRSSILARLRGCQQGWPRNVSRVS